MEKNQDKGFTLVELLIVIVILGILATVTVFAVRGITDKGEENACAVEKKTIETAAEAYYAQEGSDAAGVEALFNSGYLADNASADWEFGAYAATNGSVIVNYVATGKCA